MNTINFRVHSERVLENTPDASREANGGGDHLFGVVEHKVPRDLGTIPCEPGHLPLQVQTATNDIPNRDGHD